MNKQTFDRRTTAALRELDPGARTVLTDEERGQAEATFARILTTPSQDQQPEKAGPRRPRRRGLALAGLVGAAAVVPAFLLGGGSALASWTPTPEKLTGSALADAANACRDGRPSAVGEQTMLAERRGEWTYVLLVSPDTERACLMPEERIAEGSSEDTRSGGMGHRNPRDRETEPTPAADALEEYESGAGSVSSGRFLDFGRDEEWISWVSGFVGSDVTGVTVHTPIGVDVEASVDNGRFAAWWPSAPPSSDNLEVMGAWTYTVTLADGSTHPLTVG